MGDMGHAEYRMIHHFDQLLRDCKDPLDMERRSLEYWTAFGHTRWTKRDVHMVTVIFFIVTTLAFAALEFVTVATIGLILLTILFFGVMIGELGLEHVDLGEYRTGRGFIKKYHVQTSDAVERTFWTLNQARIPFKMFGVTLTRWPGKPRASVFLTERSGLRITVFKDLQDPYFTVVHVGGLNKKNRRGARAVMRILDRYVTEEG